MKATAFETIMSQIFEQARETKEDITVNITLKNGDNYTFSTSDNEEMAPETCEINGIIQIYAGEHCDEYGTAWIEVEEIAAIQI